MTGDDKAERQRLRDLFRDMLPAALGNPYIVNTAHKPYVFAAFYDAKRHELRDGRIINGNEIRVWRHKQGFVCNAPHACILGIDEAGPDLVLVALTDQGTTAKDVKPYGSMLREMMAEMAMGRL